MPWTMPWNLFAGSRIRITGWFLWISIRRDSWSSFRWKIITSMRLPWWMECQEPAKVIRIIMELDFTALSPLQKSTEDLYPLQQKIKYLSYVWYFPYRVKLRGDFRWGLLFLWGKYSVIMIRIRLRNRNCRLRNYQTHPSADMLWSVYQSKTGQLRNRQSKKESANGKETKA